MLKNSEADTKSCSDVVEKDRMYRASFSSRGNVVDTKPLISSPQAPVVMESIHCIGLEVEEVGSELDCDCDDKEE